MSYQEKKVAVSLVGALVVFAIYLFYVSGMVQDGRLEGPDAGSLVGRSALWLIGGSIAVSIVLQILFVIINGALTRERNFGVSDERDRLIELKAMQIILILFSIGFLASMAVLAAGWFAPPLILVMIVSVMMFANLVGDLVKFFIYRWWV